MFVRWKRRRRCSGHWAGRVRMSAILVESYRDADGKPRQRHIKYLASLFESQEKKPYHRQVFWETASRNLDELDLPEADRAKIEEALAAVVPKNVCAQTPIAV